MYIPKSFKLEDKELIIQILNEFPFATIISNNSDGIQISHLPLVLDENSNSLVGHFARANNHAEDIDNKYVVAVFHGPHVYISPSFYETQNTVPTWDYVNIHISGKLMITSSKEDLWEDVKFLTSKFESNSEKYSLNHLEPENRERLLKGIIGFRIQIETIEAKAKLNQNHSIERQRLVAEKLKSSGKENDLYIARLIEWNLSGNNSLKSE
ncbi:MAG: FMN-binding negative transcriptional regulator [Leptospiraceae bacterium]|nr:FMN-binding negative transcriptional regulator [Leptospiraceae bacterium]